MSIYNNMLRYASITLNFIFYSFFIYLGNYVFVFVVYVVVLRNIPLYYFILFTYIISYIQIVSIVKYLLYFLFYIIITIINLIINIRMIISTMDIYTYFCHNSTKNHYSSHYLAPVNEPE